jgi:hypothetical protein
MRRFSGRACLVVAGALILGLGVSGCGRKSGLDAPPSASIVEPPAAAAPAEPSPGLLFGRPAETPPPVAPPPAADRQRTFLLDWLLN